MRWVIDIPDNLLDLVQSKLEFNGDLDNKTVRRIMHIINNGMEYNTIVKSENLLKKLGFKNTTRTLTWR